MLELIYCSNDQCIICTEIIEEEKLLCDSCRNKIRFNRDSSVIRREALEIECYSAAYYTGIIVELVKKLKYYSGFDSGRVLAEFLLEHINTENIDFDIVTFVPMHKKAYKKRGFNQSRYLAKLISEELNRPVLKCLEKNFYTKDQIGLSGEGRWENQASSYRAVNEKYIKNKKILLIDDVITTGATSFYCSKELLKAGAQKVSILTVAKSKI
jgi:competence protein ComFC